MRRKSETGILWFIALAIGLSALAVGCSDLPKKEQPAAPTLMAQAADVRGMTSPLRARRASCVATTATIWAASSQAASERVSRPAT